MRKMKLIFVLLLLMGSTIIKAQSNFEPGFIITLNGDTIEGFVDSRGAVRNAKICSFKNQQEDQVMDYIPSELIAYGFDGGNFYVSRNVKTISDTTPIFLEYLINGIVDIYFYRDEANNNHYFIEKDDLKLTELDNSMNEIDINGTKFIRHSNRYIGVLNIAFNDSPSIQEKVSSIKLKRNSLIDIAMDYHNEVCEGEKCIVYSKEKLKSKFSIEPIIGIDIHTLIGNDKTAIEQYKPSGYDMEALNLPPKFSMMSNLNYSIGFKSSVTWPSFNERVSVNLQMKAGKYELYGKGNVGSNIYGLSTSGYNLMHNLFVAYTFPKGTIRPVFLVGFSYNIIFSKNEIDVLGHIYNGSGIRFTDEGSYDVLAPQYYGGLLGVGADIHISKKYIVTTSLQYNIMPDSQTLSAYYYKPLSLVIGVKRNK